MHDSSNPPCTAPELLAPAGDWDCVRAAIENGADAIYFGLETGFNARARATNFSLADLPRLLETLHRRGVKGYVTLNTLVFTDELAAFENIVRQLAAAGVDAVLMQDIGAARLVREIAPALPLHASTQMTLTSAESIALAESLGMERVVLARELSIPEILKIRQQTVMPLEVFVHGALCVAYSGQCLTSESLGGRSANRGQCAQACRLPYELICDGRHIDLAEKKYLLSPQDLAAYMLAPELIAAGIRSFKIEGRLKTPEYVANITRHYRRAIDLAISHLPVEFSPRDVEEMELSFSRGFSHGWLEGCDHKALVPADYSAKRGVLLGEVVGVKRTRIVLRLRSSLKRGDGVSFDGDRRANEEQGGRVYELFRAGQAIASADAGEQIEVAFKHGGIDFDRVYVGQRLWKNDDPELTARLRKTFTSTHPQRRRPIDLRIAATVGQPLAIEVLVSGEVAAQLVSDVACVAAREHPLTVEVLREQLGRLGQTPFELGDVAAEIGGRPMLPFSELGKLRHRIVSAVEQHLTRPRPPTTSPELVLPRLRADVPVATSTNVAPQLHVLCRSLAQIDIVAATGVRNIVCDFADIREYREAVVKARAAHANIWLATPRIQKPLEMGIFHALAKQKADGILVRNFGGLTFFRERGVPVIADFSLNITNELTAQEFMRRGVERVTASYDLNREQLLDLVSAVPPQWLEVVVHQHMPMFHMEHCVFCSVLSPGTNKTNCGRPCDHHVVQLRDHIGMEHPLTADVGCRNTLFNAVAQSSAEIVPTLLQRGVRHFRLELLHESPAEIEQAIRLYQQLLAGEIRGDEVWTQLRAANRVGITRGTLEPRRNPLAIL